MSFERRTQVPLCSYLSLSRSTQSRSVRTEQGEVQGGRAGKVEKE